jgi:hypothetical protein
VVRTSFFWKMVPRLVRISTVMANCDSDDAIRDDSDTLLPLILLLLIYRRRRRRHRTPSNRRWTGQEVVDDLLNCGNTTRIHNQLRMRLETFNQLRDWLVNNIKLNSSRYISIEEKLLIFIYITSSGVSNRAAQERFNRGAHTISL